jgi:predicted nucleic acid-binding protein
VKNVILDTNIVLDIALDRVGFSEDSAKVLVLIKQKGIKSFVTATTITDIYYILKKSKGHHHTIGFLSGLFDFIDIAGVTKDAVLAALTSDMADFEDAVQIEAAKFNEIDTIITRNYSDFEHSGLEVYTPASFIGKLSGNG